MGQKIFHFIQWCIENSSDLIKAVSVSLAGWILMGVRWLFIDVIGVTALAATKPEILFFTKMASLSVSILLTLIGIGYMLWRWQRDKRKHNHWERTKDED